jgi:hypothetical protein
MTLAQYIARYSPVVVYVRTKAGWENKTVHDARELPFPADRIEGVPANYNFVWDRVGVPLDNLGRRIDQIQAHPATESPQSESSVYF